MILEGLAVSLSLAGFISSCYAAYLLSGEDRLHEFVVVLLCAMVCVTLGAVIMILTLTGG